MRDIAEYIKLLADHEDEVSDLVHDLKSQEASQINNSGLEDQIRYILENWASSDLEEILRS